MKKKTEPVWTWLGFGNREDLIEDLEFQDRHFYYKGEQYGLTMEPCRYHPILKKYVNRSRAKEFDTPIVSKPCFSSHLEGPYEIYLQHIQPYDTWDELIDNVVIDGVPFVELLKNGWKD
jgi:hypothetical protein